MRFLNIKKLKRELRAGSLSENDAFTYFFAMLILDTLLINFSFTFFGEAELKMLDIASAIAPIFIAVSATWFLYLANGGKNGSCFFLRYFSILWVVGVRFYLFLLPLIVAWCWYIFFPDGDYAYEWEGFAVGNLLYLFFYWRVWVHMREVRGGITT